MKNKNLPTKPPFDVPKRKKVIKSNQGTIQITHHEVHLFGKFWIQKQVIIKKFSH
jgi:hypothetical protein